MKILFTILLMIFAIPAVAEPKFGDISVIDGGRQPDGTQLLGINITLEDGWHTYWRLAGQNGLDPVFDLSASENMESYEIHWPEPRLVGEEGTEAVGYYDGVEIVVSMKPEDQQQPIKLLLKMDIGICETQCVPVHREYEMELNAGYSIDGIGLKQVMSEAFDDGVYCNNDIYQWSGYPTLQEIREQNSARLLLESDNRPNDLTDSRIYIFGKNGIETTKCMKDM